MSQTLNILARTFHIRAGRRTGTAFTFNSELSRYLITAQHVVSAPDLSTIEIMTNSGWRTFEVVTVRHSDPTLDVSVLTLRRRLHDHILRVKLDTEAELKFGQDVRFAGFPFGLSKPRFFCDFPYPLPFVLHGNVTRYDDDACLMDGIRCPVMYGGPVYTMQEGYPHVIGVLTRGFDESITVPAESNLRGAGIVGTNARKPGNESNPGSVKVTRIKWAAELYDLSPRACRVCLSIPSSDSRARYPICRAHLNGQWHRPYQDRAA